jgi:hypothetical protein
MTYCDMCGRFDEEAPPDHDRQDLFYCSRCVQYIAWSETLPERVRPLIHAVRLGATWRRVDDRDGSAIEIRGLGLDRRERLSAEGLERFLASVESPHVAWRRGR